MPQVTVAPVFSRLDHSRPNSFLSRTAIQMLYKTTPPFPQIAPWPTLLLPPARAVDELAAEQKEA